MELRASSLARVTSVPHHVFVWHRDRCVVLCCMVLRCVSLCDMIISIKLKLSSKWEGWQLDQDQ